MKPTEIIAHTKFRIAPVDPRVFGGFLEHLGRAVYEGIYDPESAHADADGCRTDVLAALRRLDMTAMRYPGGNFVSGYHWQDGVGPPATRPTVHSFVRHADVVKIANLAQIVNVIAPILTRGDDLLMQSIFYPFEMFSKRRTGVALQLAVDGPGYEGASNGCVNYVDASAILNDSALHLFLTNRSVNASADVSLAPADVSIAACRSAEVLTGPDAKAANSFERRGTVKTDPFTAVDVRGGRVHCQLPPLSFVAMTLQCA